MNLTRFAFPAALALLTATPALAALGADVTSVQADLAHMKGAVRVTESTGFSVHEISTSYGTRVREFTGGDGKVFAVAWDGPVNPDLRQVLGSYYDQFVTAAAAGEGRPPPLGLQPPATAATVIWPSSSPGSGCRTTAGCGPSAGAPGCPRCCRRTSRSTRFSDRLRPILQRNDALCVMQ